MNILRLTGIITVSNGVKEELAIHTGLSPHTITTIYNPVLIQKIRGKSLSPSTIPGSKIRNLSLLF
jgi:hypothetical protein